MRFPGTATRLVLLVLVVGAIVRVAFWFDWGETPFATRAVEDEEFYDAWATELLEGRRDAGPYHMSPLPAYVLAAEYAMLGRDFARVRLVHAVVGLVAVVLAFLATREAFGARPAVVGALLAALYAPAVFYESSLLPLSATLTLALALVWCAVATDRRLERRERAWPWALAAGVATGGLVLLRGNAILLVPALAVLLAVRGHRTLPGARRGVVVLALLAGSVLPILPVTVHNLRGGDLVPITWHMGQNLYIGNREGATGLYVPLVPGRHAPEEEREDARRLAEEARGRALSPSEISAYWTGRALAFATEDPVAFAALALRKLRFVLSAYEFPDAHDFYYAADRSRVLALLPGFGVLLPLAVIGLVLGRRERATPLLALGAAVYVLSVVAAFVFGRYRLPVAAFLFPLAGVGVVRLVAIVRERSWQRAVPALVAGAIAFGITLLPSVPRAYGLASTYFNVGRIHELDGNARDAHRAYTRAVEYNAAHAKSLRGVVRTGLVTGMPGPELLPVAERALAVDPDDPMGWVLAGNVLLVSGRPVEARRAFAHALRIAPGYAPAREALSRLDGTASERGR